MKQFDVMKITATWNNSSSLLSWNSFWLFALWFVLSVQNIWKRNNLFRQWSRKRVHLNSCLSDFIQFHLSCKKTKYFVHNRGVTKLSQTYFFLSSPSHVRIGSSWRVLTVELHWKHLEGPKKKRSLYALVSYTCRDPGEDTESVQNGPGPRISQWELEDPQPPPVSPTFPATSCW